MTEWNQVEENEYPSICIRSTPVTNWLITAGVVNNQSARTTCRAVMAIATTFEVRLAINMKKAIPIPVPATTMALRIWIIFSKR